MALRVSKLASIEVCLIVSQTTHDLYGLKFWSLFLTTTGGEKNKEEMSDIN
jgi:hypothetical protein